LGISESRGSQSSLDILETSNIQQILDISSLQDSVQDILEIPRATDIGTILSIQEILGPGDIRDILKVLHTQEILKTQAILNILQSNNYSNSCTFQSAWTTIMAEVAALSLVCNIFQVISFAHKVYDVGKKISETGTSDTVTLVSPGLLFLLESNGAGLGIGWIGLS